MAPRNRKEITLYTISQVVALTGVPASTIRFWERVLGEFCSPSRSIGGQRRYDDQAVTAVKRINHLVNGEGYTLEGARRQLRAEAKGHPTADQAGPKLTELAETMSDVLLRKLLQQMKA